MNHGGLSASARAGFVSPEPVWNIHETERQTKTDRKRDRETQKWRETQGEYNNHY